MRSNFSKISFLLLCSFSFLGTAQAKLEQVYEGTLPWGDRKITAELEVPKPWDQQGAYTTLTLSENGKKIFSLKNLHAGKISSVGSFPEATESYGEYLKMIPLDSKATVRGLVLANWVGGAQQDQFIIIVMDDKGVPYTALRKSLYISTLKDYDDDGKIDILVHGGSGEPVGEGLFSYDPYLVYKQKNKANKVTFEIDEGLSKKWSQENHYEWHGSKYSEKILVNEKGEAGAH